MFLKRKHCILKNDTTKNRLISKVGIIIATYNRPQMLDRALESALTQNYSEISVIVVDNGDLSETQEIAMKYINLDERVCYLKNKSRKGAAETRNYGLFYLNQEIHNVFFLDDDDRFCHSDSLRDIVKSHCRDCMRLMTYGIQRDVNTDGSLYQIWPCKKDRLIDLIIDEKKIQFPAHTVLWNANFARVLGGYRLEFENDMEDIAFIVDGFVRARLDWKAVKYIDTAIVDWRRGHISEDTLHSKIRRKEPLRRFTRERMKKKILYFEGY